ncbi:unnamed protein product [Peronospora belbahrii]|uniref:Elicitin n=1 Tax=Peronospora belbahrii TaxID=622444 RepID=A0AAU9KYN3_9STRA|nr:unnamed protein product [Peronospora belbahrii]CAH0516122.1 unnamed protein product [Peronospora belbahrii]
MNMPVVANSTTTICDNSTVQALLTNEHTPQCATDAVYNFSVPSLPTPEQIDRMCQSSACLDLLANLTALQTTECILPGGNNFFFRANLTDYIPPRCGGNNAATTDDTGASMEPSTATNNMLPSSPPTQPQATSDSSTTLHVKQTLTIMIIGALAIVTSSW